MYITIYCIRYLVLSQWCDCSLEVMRAQRRCEIQLMLVHFDVGDDWAENTEVNRKESYKSLDKNEWEM